MSRTTASNAPVGAGWGHGPELCHLRLHRRVAVMGAPAGDGERRPAGRGVASGAENGRPVRPRYPSPMDPSRTLAFAGVALLVILFPGPSVLFIVSRSLSLGRRRLALLTVAGNELGELVQVCAVALGIGALVAVSALAFTVVKLAGAAYLVYLGVQTVRSRRLAAAIRLPARSLRWRLPAAGRLAGLRGRAQQPQDDRVLRGGAAPVRRPQPRARPSPAAGARAGLDRDRAGLRQLLGAGGERGPVVVHGFARGASAGSIGAAGW